MQPTRNKHINSRKKQIPALNPQLKTAQMTLTRGPITKPSTQLANPNINPKQVLLQAQQLYLSNEVLECINLLKGLLEYLRNIKYGDQKILTIVHTNLAVSYYKIGFLEESYDEFASVVSIIKDITLSLRNANQTSAKASSLQSSTIHSKLCQKLRYDMLTTRIQLQTCILFSEMGKHELALDHAKLSCKSCYNMVFDLQIILYQKLNSLVSSQNKNKTNYNAAYAPESEIAIQGYENLINNIVMIDQLLSASKDLRQQFLTMNKQKGEMLEQERASINKIGKLPTKSDIEKVYELVPENVESLWVFKNKILDQIQMKFIDEDVLDIKHIYENSEAIEKVVYLAISLYCYSTETRFMEKDCVGKDPCEVLDSEHWLSRSLEIAYSFMPQQAPILSQILTVHDRFHGIDKQTIPEDREVGGYFKVLRPLSKPKSTFSSKNIMGAPIMIRIQVPKISISEQRDQIQSTQLQGKGGKMKIRNKNDHSNHTIDLELGDLTKNNKIRGLNTTKKFDFADSQTVIRRKHNTKIDFSENLKNIYASRKMKSASETHSKTDKMKLNLTSIKDGNKDETSFKEGGSKSMRRPHSYDKEISKPEQHFFPIQTERKKKPFSQTRKEGAQKRRSLTTNSTGLKLDGLQMLPNNLKKSDEDDYFEISSKLSNNIEASRMGGNIFISNNINLFISKDSLESSKNLKGGEKSVFEISKRQSYMNRRRAQNSSSVGNKNLEFE